MVYVHFRKVWTTEMEGETTSKTPSKHPLWYSLLPLLASSIPHQTCAHRMISQRMFVPRATKKQVTIQLIAAGKTQPSNTLKMPGTWPKRSKEIDLCIYHPSNLKFLFQTFDNLLCLLCWWHCWSDKVAVDRDNFWRHWKNNVFQTTTNFGHLYPFLTATHLTVTRDEQKAIRFQILCFSKRP